MSTLHQVVKDYLSIRRALGYKLERAGHLLPDFIRFVEHSGGSTVTEELALQWAMLPRDASPYWWASRLNIVRCFAKYLRGLNPKTEVPSRELLPHRSTRAQPHLYTEAEIRDLMAACAKLSAPLIQSTYATLLGLLYITGMRVGEAICLDRTDLDENNHVLVIRNSKFGKSRELMLHETTVQSLLRHAELRDHVVRNPRCPAFFMSRRGTRLHYKNVHRRFSRLREWTGLADREPRPRIHDMRHSFAITTIIGWYRDGLDVQARLPRLSTYLGHVAPNSTYWYMTAVPELLTSVAGRLTSALGNLP